MSRRTDSDAPTITAAYPRLLLGLLEERGLDGRALLREIGLSTLRLEEPEARVTSQQYQAIAAAALALSGDPGLGAQLALRTPPTAHGSLGYAMMASATLGDALCLALRYMPLLQGNVEISLLREDEQVILRLLPGPALPPALHRYFSEALLIGLYRSGAWLLGEPALVGRLNFDYPEPAVPVPLPQCRYDQAHVQLVFPAILLVRSLPMADPAALRRAREHCERELALLDAGRRDICARVRLELERQEQRFPNLEEVATRLHLSSRSLKRHLHDAGTSFRQLLGQARQRQALRLLRRPEVSLPAPSSAGPASRRATPAPACWAGNQFHEQMPSARQIPRVSLERGKRCPMLLRPASGRPRQRYKRDFMKPAIKRACLLGTALFSLCASAAQAAGVLVGTWDLRGNGQLAAVYRDGANLQVVEGGSTRNYSFGNVVWSVFGATDTDGQPGAEILVKAGPDLVIVSHASTTQRKYPVGNVSWAIMRATDVDNVAGDEVILSIGNGVRTVFDRTRTQRDATFSYNGTWGLFDVADVDGAPGKELVLNMGNGVKVIDPRTSGAKDFTFSGYHALAQIADLDGQPGAEIIGRTSTGIYVISNATSRKEYSIGASAWALYGGTADTDGKPGNELIVVMQGKVRVIHHASGASSDYRIGDVNYSIDSVADMDGQPGAEILVRDANGKLFVINDRTGKVSN